MTLNTSLRKIIVLTLGLGLLILLVNCQPVPKPFAAAHKGDFRAIQIGPRAGMIVAPMTGDITEEAGDRLATAMAAALRQREITAATAHGHRRSHHLRGEAAWLSTQQLRLTWRLFGPDGTQALTFDQDTATPPAAWQNGDPALLARLANVAADTVDRRLRGQERGQGRRIALASVTMGPVDGVPGPGGRQLAAAMHAALRAAGVPMSDDAKDDGFILLGSMHVSPDGAGQRIEMVWHLIRPDGREFGKVSQANTVPKGQLGGDWHHLARAIARAGAPGVRDLLRRDPG